MDANGRGFIWGDPWIAAEGPGAAGIRKPNRYTSRDAPAGRR